MKDHSRSRGKGKRLGYRTPSTFKSTVRGGKSRPPTKKNKKA